jgi:hypothetical protein
VQVLVELALPHQSQEHPLHEVAVVVVQGVELTALLVVQAVVELVLFPMWVELELLIPAAVEVVKTEMDWLEMVVLVVLV